MAVITVLIVDSTEWAPDVMPLELLPAGTRIVTETADSTEAFEALLQWFEPDLVLANFALPGLSGLDVLARLQSLRPSVPVVFVASARDDEEELEALKHGARDYVLKGDRARLMAALLHARTASMERRVREDTMRKLQDSELRFRLFMEHMPGAAYMKDLEGRFTFANSIALGIMGRPAEKVIGYTLRQLYPADVADVLAANDRRALDVRQPSEALEDLETPEGQRTFLSIKFPVMGADGQPVMIGGFSVDITRLRSVGS